MSNSVATQQKRFIRLAPSNNSTSGYAPSGSQPILRFSIADTAAFAKMSDARLNCRIKVERAPDTAVAQTDDFNIDPVLGWCSMVDQITVSSRRFGSTIEQVNNMARLDSAYYRSKYAPKDINSNMYSKTRAVGLGRFNRISGSTAGHATVSDKRLVAQRKKLITTVSTNPKDAGFVEVSIPLHAGFFLTDSDVDLSQIGGVEISIYLAKVQSVFFGTGANQPTSNSNYTLYDASLTVPLLYKSAEQVSMTPPEGSVEFLNWTSLFSVVDSTVSSIAHRLYLSGLVSQIHNFLPTDQLNNVSANAAALKDIGVERLTFQKDGVRSPMEKTVLTDKVANVKVQQSPSLYSEVITDYTSALHSPRDIKRTQIIPENMLGIADRSGVMGIGCNFSPNSAGINLSGVLSIDVQSKIPDSTGTGTTPYAMFSFYLSRKAFLTSPMGVKQI